MTELHQAVSELRQALDDIEAELTQQDPPAAALEDFKVTLDNVRTNVLAFLTAADSADYYGFVRKFRLRRAAQVCQAVLSGIVDGTIDPDTPGFDRFRSTVEETLERLERLRGHNT